MIRSNAFLKQLFTWTLSACGVVLSSIWLALALVARSRDTGSGDGVVLGFYIACIAMLVFAFTSNPLSRKYISFLSSRKNALIFSAISIALCSIAGGRSFIVGIQVDDISSPADLFSFLNEGRSKLEKNWIEDVPLADSNEPSVDTSSEEAFGWPGLTVGMSLDQARAVIEKQGYPIASSPNPTPDATGDVAYAYEYVEPSTINQIGTFQIGTSSIHGRRFLYVSKIYPDSSQESAKKTFNKLVSYYKDAYGNPDYDAMNEDGESNTTFCISKRVALVVIIYEQRARVEIFSSDTSTPLCARTPESQRSAALYPALPMRPRTEVDVTAASAASAPTQNPDVKSTPIDEQEAADNVPVYQLDSTKDGTDAGMSKPASDNALSGDASSPTYDFGAIENQAREAFKKGLISACGLTNQEYKSVEAFSATPIDLDDKGSVKHHLDALNGGNGDTSPAVVDNFIQDAKSDTGTAKFVRIFNSETEQERAVQVTNKICAEKATMKSAKEAAGKQ